MRARDKRPTAWQAHLLIRERRGWTTVPTVALDALTMGATALASFFGSGLASAALPAMAFELTRRELGKKDV